MLTALRERLTLPDYVLAGSIVVMIIISSIFLSGFSSLPGPLYGGDVYYHYGKINQLADGGSVFESSHYAGEAEHYGWLSNLLTASLTYVGLSPLAATITFTAIMQILAAIVAYLLISAITRKEVGLLFALLVLFDPMLNLPTHFSRWVLIPLGFYAIVKHKPVFTGLVYGACGLAHPISFFGLNLLIPLNVLKRSLEAKERVTQLKQDLMHYAKVYAIGIPIALVYWGPLVVRYAGRTVNNWQEYNTTDLFLWQALRALFLNSNTVLTIALSILAIIGLIVAIRNAKYRIALLPLAVLVIGLVHPLITQPLLGTSLGYFGFRQYQYLTSIVLAAVGLGWIWNKLPDGETLRIGTIALVVLIASASAYANYTDFRDHRWTQSAFSTGNAVMIDNPITQLIDETTTTDDVFLTLHPESSFALNGMTGRPVVHLRITHASTFVDANQRILDAAIMLYSNESSAVDERIEQYDVSYFWVDSYGRSNLNRCLQFFAQGTNDEASYACLRIDYDEDAIETLEEHDLTYRVVTARKNVASNDAPRFEQIAIAPKDGVLFERLSVVQRLTDQNGQPIFELYAVE